MAGCSLAVMVAALAAEPARAAAKPGLEELWRQFPLDAEREGPPAVAPRRASSTRPAGELAKTPPRAVLDRPAASSRSPVSDDRRDELAGSLRIAALIVATALLLVAVLAFYGVGPPLRLVRVQGLRPSRRTRPESAERAPAERTRAAPAAPAAADVRPRRERSVANGRPASATAVVDDLVRVAAAAAPRRAAAAVPITSRSGRRSDGVALDVDAVKPAGVGRGGGAPTELSEEALGIAEPAAGATTDKASATGPPKEIAAAPHPDAKPLKARADTDAGALKAKAQAEAEVLKAKAHADAEALKARARPKAPPRDLPRIAAADADALNRKPTASPPADALKAKALSPERPRKPLAAADAGSLKEKLAPARLRSEPDATGEQRSAAAPPGPAPWLVVTPAPAPRLDRPPPRLAAVPAPPPAASPAQPGRRDAAALAGTAPAQCEIRWWRGYFKAQFVAVEIRGDGTDVTVASSSLFRCRGRGAPPDTPEAAAALRTLVESLEGRGWSVSGRGKDWFSLRLQLDARARRIGRLHAGQGTSPTGRTR